MKIQHLERFEGRITTAQYPDENGWPTAASFTGWLSREQVDRELNRLRTQWARSQKVVANV